MGHYDDQYAIDDAEHAKHLAKLEEERMKELKKKLGIDKLEERLKKLEEENETKN